MRARFRNVLFLFDRFCPTIDRSKQPTFLTPDISATKRLFGILHQLKVGCCEVLSNGDTVVSALFPQTPNFSLQAFLIKLDNYNSGIG